MIKFVNFKMLGLGFLLFINHLNLNAMGFLTELRKTLFSSPTANQMLIEGIMEADQTKVKSALALKPDLYDTNISSEYAKSGAILDNALNNAIVGAKINGKKMFPIIELLIEAGADVNRKGAEGVPLSIAIDPKYYNYKIYGELFKFLMNYGADYNSSFFISFLEKVEYDSGVHNSTFRMIMSVIETNNALLSYPSALTLRIAISNNACPVVKILLCKGFELTPELLASIPKDITTQQLRRLLVSYLRLMGPLGTYKKEKNISSEAEGGQWVPDEKLGPISRSGILTMNAIDDNRIITLPEEVILTIIKYVI